MMKQGRTAQPGVHRKIVLWWGRFDPGYSRNRILRKQFIALGWDLMDFHPGLSLLGDLQAHLRGLPSPDLVWVPCFRQRDLLAASRWAKRKSVPLIFDPLISAYDKQVDERGKLDLTSARAQRLLAWERKLFQRADRVIADTPAHADYFVQMLGVERGRVNVIYVGAEASLFRPRPRTDEILPTPLEVLFYGSFIPLQGPQVVIEAARLYRGPPVKWTLLGHGPLRAACEKMADGLRNVSFEGWLPYEALPARIHRADILLGVFGTTAKADRVIPNKVFQALASGKVVVTRLASAYPEEMVQAKNCGLVWVEAGNGQSLADQIALLAANPDRVRELGEAAAETSVQFFSEAILGQQLEESLKATATWNSNR